MNDTLKEAQEFQNKLLDEFSGEEKVLMAAGMFDAAKQIIISSLPDNLSKKEILKEIFLRFYEDDFSKSEINNIMKAIDKKI